MWGWASVGEGKADMLMQSYARTAAAVVQHTSSIVVQITCSVAASTHASHDAIRHPSRLLLQVGKEPFDIDVRYSGLIGIGSGAYGNVSSAYDSVSGKVRKGNEMRGQG